ncbi:MAG: LptF/LptG family permease [Verrucomicrobium sp.]
MTKTIPNVLQPLLNVGNAVWRWLRHSPHSGWVALLIALGVMFVCQAAGYHLRYMPVTPSNINELPKSWEAPPDGAYFTLYILAYMRLFVLVGGVAYHVFILRAYPHARNMVLPTWIACGYLALWAMVSQFYERWEVNSVSFSGEVFSVSAFAFQLLLIIGLLCTPPVILTYYARSKLLERYVLRSFLQPVMFCLIAFATLWIVMDLLDNMQDFQENKITRGQIFLYYVKLIPFIFVTVAPITLLLSTLYTLGRMSRTNELISMLGAGKSMFQVLKPFYIIACCASLLGLAANYHWAPVSAGNKEKLLENVKERIGKNFLVMGLMYRNQEDRRTWFVGQVPEDLRNDRLRRIEIRQENAQGRLEKGWFAKSTFWWPDRKVWTLYSGVEVTYKNGQVVSMQEFGQGTGAQRLDLENWTETPWILVSGTLVPDYLGVPDLISYIRGNAAYGTRKLSPYWTHLFYRFTFPWQCLVVVLFAAPLSVVFSRRGLVGGLATAVIFFFVLMFTDHLFLNLGKSNTIPPLLSVCLPHLLLGGLGVYLFKLRSENRDLPKISFKSLREKLVAIFQSLRARIFVKTA